MDQVLWKPSEQRIQKSSMHKLFEGVQSKFGLNFDNYQDFHKWSVEKPESFWSELFPFFNIKFEGDLSPACTDLGFTEYGWFPNIRLNFAENLLQNETDNIALNFVHESGLKNSISYNQLKNKTASLATFLKDYINEGDVLAAYMPNIPETAISMLATSSLGGVFTSTSSDFGIEGVVDRFSQSKPKVLVAACGYEYNGKYFDLIERIADLEKRLPGLEKIIIVDFLDKKPDLSKISKAVSWNEIISNQTHELSFKRISFNSPLYIMYSSGTTGKPKCIVHSVGGVLLQHLKELGLHTDLTEEKNIFYFTTCGWMMWNWLISSLAFGAKITLFDGSPGYPSLEEFFKIIDREKINIFGTSPKFLRALEDSGYEKSSSFESLETILSTGAPLLPEQYDFIYNKIKSDVLVGSICGGTDIIGCFMLGNPILPVHRGEIQCLGLGMDVSCVNDSGEKLVDQEGELVCLQSFPSRPIYFLDDKNNEKIKKAYFEKFPGIWHHGDFITLTKRDSVQVFGRSDATLNPGGVRIGTAEIYRQTEQLKYLEDSLCVGRQADGDVEVILFVKMAKNESLSKERILEIKKTIKTNTTPRHMPKEVYAISDIPYTRSGKKMELAITRILAGKKLTNVEAVANPNCLEEYSKFVVNS